MKQTTHTGAYGIIEKDKKVVLVLKSKGPYTGSWDLPGGKIDVGQDPEEALTQKVLAETGLEISGVDLKGIFNHRMVHEKTPDSQPEEFFHIGILYHAQPQARAKIKNIYSDESLGARWFSREELANLPLTPFAQKIML